MAPHLFEALLMHFIVVVLVQGFAFCRYPEDGLLMPYEATFSIYKRLLRCAVETYCGVDGALPEYVHQYVERVCTIRDWCRDSLRLYLMARIRVMSWRCAGSRRKDVT